MLPNLKIFYAVLPAKNGNNLIGTSIKDPIYYYIIFINLLVNFLQY